MTTFYLILQLAVLLGFPLLSKWISRASRIGHILSPIVLCYLMGILLRNFDIFPLQDEISQRFSEGAILFAIPLLLYTTRLEFIRRHAGKALYSFLLCAVAGVISSAAGAWFFRQTFSESWALSGMVTGIYTGGTPNMQAIGLALQVEQEYIILLNAADIVIGGTYLLLLTSIMHPLLGYVLPEFTSSTPAVEAQTTEEQPPGPSLILKALGLTVLILGATVGSTLLLFGNLEQTAFIMLALTTFSLAASFLPGVRTWQNTFAIGEYFLFVFSIALGMLADVGDIIAYGGDILLFVAVIMYSTILLHLLFSRWAKIDRDTFMVTSTAALYGPAFIGPICAVIKNKEVLFAGIAMGLLGYAVGNYLGISLAWLLQWWLG